MGPGMTSSSRDTGDGEKQNVIEWLNVLFVTWAAPADIGVDLSLFDDDCTLLLTWIVAVDYVQKMRGHSKVSCERRLK